MKCAWDSFINLLPQWLKSEMPPDVSDTLQEMRLRIQKPPELVTSKGNYFLRREVKTDDIRYCINAATRYSPWAEYTSKFGYITAPGGHRIGLCGQALTVADRIDGIRTPTSVCIRIARDFPGLAEQLDKYSGSILVIGSPGSGKTTLLRDIIRRRSDQGHKSVSVIDEKSELFPDVNNELFFDSGSRTDIMRGCNKAEGISCVLRNMGPGCIVVDEITAQKDCEALCDAARCGVEVIASAHATDKYDLYNRLAYRPIVDMKIFDTLVILKEDKSFCTERMSRCI